MNLFDKKFLYLEWDDCLKGKKVAVGDLLQLMRKEVNDGVVKLRCVEENNSDLHPFIDDCGTDWALVYYDPNYECKVAYAQGKTIQCKSLHIPDDKWEDCVCGPEWADHCEYRVKPEEPAPRVYKCSDDTLHISDSCVIDFLFEGTEEECKQYIKEHYCDRCAHQSCMMKANTQFCEGFKEHKQKRRMTNRELSKWLAHGNGECRDEEGMVIDIQYRYCVNREDYPCDDGTLIRGWDEEEWHEPEVEEG